MAAERAGRAGAERRHAACLRAQQATSADELRALAAHPSWRVRRCVAWNQRSSRETVASLLRDPHHRVRAVAVHRPQVLGDDLLVLAGERHPTVLTLLVGRIDAPTPLLAALVADPAVGAMVMHRLAIDPRVDGIALAGADLPAVRALAAGRPLPEATQRLLAKDPDPTVAVALARAPTTTPDVLRVLAMTPVFDVGVAVAGRHDLTPAVIAVLRKGPLRVVEALAANPTIDARTLDRLARRTVWGAPSERVRRRVAANPSASPATLTRLTRGRVDVASAAIANPSLPVSRLELVAASDFRLPVKIAAARSIHVGSLSPQTLDRLAASPRVAVALAANPSTPADVIRRLASLDNRPVGSYVLGAAFANPQLDADTLDRLAARSDLTAWQLAALARNPSMTPATRDSVLTWVALGGAIGDATFDPVTDVGHPGDPEVEAAWVTVDRFARVEIDPERPLEHPLGRVRATAVAGRTSSPYDLLLLAAADESPEVRHVALNFNPLRSDIVTLLRDDDDPWIADRATRAVVATRRNADSKKTRSQAILVALLLAGVGRIITAGSGYDGPLDGISPGFSSQALPVLAPPALPSPVLPGPTAVPEPTIAPHDVRLAAAASGLSPGFLATGCLLVGDQYLVNFDSEDAQTRNQQIGVTFAPLGDHELRPLPATVLGNGDLWLPRPGAAPVTLHMPPHLLNGEQVSAAQSRTGKFGEASVWKVRAGDFIVFYPMFGVATDVTVAGHRIDLGLPWEGSCIAIDDRSGAQSVTLLSLDADLAQVRSDNATVDVVLDVAPVTPPAPSLDSSTISAKGPS